MPIRTEYVRYLSLPIGVKICKPNIFDKPISKLSILSIFKTPPASTKLGPAKLTTIASERLNNENRIGIENVITTLMDLFIKKMNNIDLCYKKNHY